MTELTFLGTGDFQASERYWNAFVIDRRILVEPSPAVLPNLRRCGLAAADLDAVFVSHFHADHTFGWPFLLAELVAHRGRDPVYVVGPPGIQARLAEMMQVGSVHVLQEAADRQLDLRYVEVDGSDQTAGPIRFRAVEVVHVPYLRCFGYLFDLGDRVVGYSGDTTPCGGLDELAASCETLVLECNGPHPEPVVHMDVKDVSALRSRFPEVRLVLTHRGRGIDARGIANCIMPDDFETLKI